MRNKRALLSSAALFFFTVPLVFSEPEQRLRGDAFITPSIGEPSDLIPFLASDSASAELSHLIFNGLVKYDKDLRLVGDLAESWDVLEGGRKIIFHLRSGVLWQDGVPFTARDVVFTYERLNDPKVPTPYGASFSKVESVKALDEATLEVEYSEPFSPGLASWGMGIVPEHLLKDEDLRATKFSRAPIGTGPYKMDQWLTGQQITLRANPDYFEGPPNIERYVTRIIPDLATTFLELQTEGVDTAALTPLQFEKQIQTDFFKKTYKTFHWTGMQYAYLGYNLLDPKFADRRVRKAIGLAIDKDEIVRAVWMGRARVSTGPFLPESWAYEPSVMPTKRDLEAAKALLAEAGWVDSDRDGILDKDGKPFVFTTLINQGNDQRKMTCELIQKRLRDAGIDMKIRVVEWSVMLKEFIFTKRFDAVLMAWNMAVDPDIYPIFHSSQTGPGQFNFVSYKNEEVDQLLEEGRRLFPESDRAVVYRRVHQLIAEDEPYTFLYEPQSLAVLHRRFQGVAETPLGIGHDFIRWYVPVEQQRYRMELSSD